ncbi:MAG: MFS transporter [Acidobacteriia bacterium]|nr:MFS transporter [Terriglobia bacterium]
MASTIAWGRSLRALRSRNYRLFFAGQSVSLIGTWMTRLAMSWIVYQLTDSAFLLGLTSFVGQIPAFFVAPIAGVWLDRWNRHRVLVITQVLAMIQSLALAILAFTGWINLWWVIGLALMQGLINAFDMPARQAFVIEMIEERGDLGNAIALNSSMVNGAKLVGPAIAGVLVATAGAGVCFLIDGLSYIAVIYSLLAMRVAPVEPRLSRKSALEELGEGWKYVVQSPAIRSILLLLALTSVIGMPYTVLMPLIAAEILHGGAHTLGFLMAMSGVGALASAIGLALRKTVIGLGKRIGISAAVFGGGLILLGVSRSLTISLLLMVVTGFGMMQQMAASNTILQTIAADDKRGRVMSFYTLSILGMNPIGSLLAGAVAARIGVPVTMIGAGAICLAGAVWFRWKLPEIRRVIRPIYQELGILPQPVEVLPAPPEG